jgi:hypothetical protein
VPPTLSCPRCGQLLELEPPELTFLAEKLTDEETLTVLAKHTSPLVREGAVYGLAKIDTLSARGTLATIAAIDPSPGVREAAREALEP